MANLIKKIEITLENGRYLVNGKKYEELDFYESKFLNDYFFEMRNITERENTQKTMKTKTLLGLATILLIVAGALCSTIDNLIIWYAGAFCLILGMGLMFLISCFPKDYWE